VFAGVVVLALLAACDDPFELPAPTQANQLEAVSLWALNLTPVGLPSAYSIPSRRPVRLDQSASFDFLFDIGPAGELLFYPTDAQGLTGNSGLQTLDVEFAALVLAPTTGYEDSSAVAVVVDDVVVARSRLDDCFIGDRPHYAKFRVVAADLTDRRVDLEILANPNCGYRSLEPGLPTR
jgi:hypothetical protein